MHPPSDGEMTENYENYLSMVTFFPPLKIRKGGTVNRALCTAERSTKARRTRNSSAARLREAGTDEEAVCLHRDINELRRPPSIAAPPNAGMKSKANQNLSNFYITLTSYEQPFHGPVL